MLKLYWSLLFLICIGYGEANLEGPFLFFGPKCLEEYKRPALKYLEQDDLMKIYEDQSAIVVFNNRDPMPLSSNSFPRLRKVLERQSYLVLPQDFLDVHPDYVSNDTQMLTLLGPWSERDAQMTETFARLQDIYGHGKVLGILGNSVSQSSLDYDDDQLRYRRAADEVTSTPTSEDDRPTKPPPKFALFNATGPPGKGVLLYSSSWPELRWSNGTTMILDTPVGVPTVKATKLYTILVVRFSDGENNRDKIVVEFSFKQSAGWWTAVGVEVKRSLEPMGVSLQAPQAPDAPSAVLDRSYHCSLPLVYSGDNVTLTLRDVRMQPYMDRTEGFADSFDCIGFTTVPIWSGLMVVSIMLMGLAVSIIMISDIKTMDRFENSRSKMLTITVSE